MKIFLVESTCEIDYDMVVGTVIACENLDMVNEVARRVYRRYSEEMGKVKITCLGEASAEIKEGEILTSYNAG